MKIAELANSVSEQRPEEAKAKSKVRFNLVCGCMFFLLAIASFILSYRFGTLWVIKGVIHILLCLRFFSRASKFKKRYRELEQTKSERERLSQHDKNRVGEIQHALLKVKGGGALEEVQTLIKKHSKFKEDLVTLDDHFRICFGRSLVEELKDVSQSYATIEQGLNEFIVLGIVEPKYPHSYT